MLNGNDDEWHLIPWEGDSERGVEVRQLDLECERNPDEITGWID